MGANKRSYEDLRNSDIKENMSEGIEMRFSPPRNDSQVYTKHDLYKAAQYGHDFGSTVAYTVKYDTLEDMINDLMGK